MKYVAKRPAVEAIQFTGLKSVQDIKFLSRAQGIKYEDFNLAGGILHIQVNGNQYFIEVRRGDYVVRNCGQTTVMSEYDFEAKYELVEPVNENAVPDPTTSHSINPFYGTAEAPK
ncbi:MAG: hypothetical protein ABFD89_20100 [Bryobacteraceae bacterium]